MYRTTTYTLYVSLPHPICFTLQSLPFRFGSTPPFAVKCAWQNPSHFDWFSFVQSGTCHVTHRYRYVCVYVRIEYVLGDCWVNVGGKYITHITTHTHTHTSQQTELLHTFVCIGLLHTHYMSVCLIPFALPCSAAVVSEASGARPHSP
jgi:hypothetical protein